MAECDRTQADGQEGADTTEQEHRRLSRIWELDRLSDGRPVRSRNAEGTCFRFFHADGEAALTRAVFEWRHPWGRGHSRIEFHPGPGQEVTEDELRAKARVMGWPGHSGRMRDYARQVGRSIASPMLARFWEWCRAAVGAR